VGGEE